VVDYSMKFVPATVAEREGFEPSVEILSLRRFSKPLPSATRPPLHVTIVGIGPHPQRKLSPGRDITDAEASYLSSRERHKG
jgi:hypothetical protein